MQRFLRAGEPPAFYFGGQAGFRDVAPFRASIGTSYFDSLFKTGSLRPCSGELSPGIQFFKNKKPSQKM